MIEEWSRQVEEPDQGMCPSAVALRQAAEREERRRSVHQQEEMQVTHSSLEERW